MYITTPRLTELLKKYGIASHTPGKREDKLGDVFEDYCAEILSDPDLLQKYLAGQLSDKNTDEIIFKLILDRNEIPNTTDIIKIEASTNIEHRITGGNAKTDVLADITYKDGSVIQIPISVKQTRADKVAMAEFSVATIKKEVGIKDKKVIELMTKHQVDGSAKNFTKDQKTELKTKLKPYAVDLVRWVISGTIAKNSTDLRHPKLILKIKVDKKANIKKISIFNIEEYIDIVIKTKKGKLRWGGFGTGLSWTYATGSKGEKIQFKA
ncbi:MAG: MspI family type II restriction endonuclease [Clostridia bacterium]|nr:MspI family type II restriction endonuclease [Clostridia bacterium]